MPTYLCVACGEHFATKKQTLEHCYDAHVEILRDQAAVEHRTDRGYYAHRRLGVPFPEDTGADACGCRAAHSQAVNEWNREWRRGFGFRTPGGRNDGNGE